MSEIAHSHQAGVERRFFFRVDRVGEISSTVTGSDCSDKLTKRPFSASVLKSKTVSTPRVETKRPTSASVHSQNVPHSTEFRSAGTVNQITPRFRVQTMSYYSVSGLPPVEFMTVVHSTIDRKSVV